MRMQNAIERSGVTVGNLVGGCVSARGSCAHEISMGHSRCKVKSCFDSRPEDFAQENDRLISGTKSTNKSLTAVRKN